MNYIIPVQMGSPEQSRETRETIHHILLAATEVGAKEIGATGASFVIIGMGVWATELAELARLDEALRCAGGV